MPFQLNYNFMFLLIFKNIQLFGIRRRIRSGDPARDLRQGLDRHRSEIASVRK